ncbi:hypothetical protein A2U01_0081845, partial [Trifolium medium]|nr:hypothetical protein [Trifolium medium]
MGAPGGIVEITGGASDTYGSWSMLTWSSPVTRPNCPSCWWVGPYSGARLFSAICSWVLLLTPTIDRRFVVVFGSFGLMQG